MDLNLPVPAPSRANSVAVYVAFNQRGRPRPPKVQIVRQGPVPRGVVVWEKTGDILTEVTEFSEAPLDAGLFEVPAGYRLAAPPVLPERLSWDDWLLLRWQQLEDWLNRLL
jgi:hypothetical protein